MTKNLLIQAKSLYKRQKAAFSSPHTRSIHKKQDELPPNNPTTYF